MFFNPHKKLGNEFVDFIFQASENITRDYTSGKKMSSAEILRFKFCVSIYYLSCFTFNINLIGRDKNVDGIMSIIDSMFIRFKNSINDAFNNIEPNTADFIFDPHEISIVKKDLGARYNESKGLTTSFDTLLYFVLDKRVDEYMEAFPKWRKEDVMPSFAKMFFKHYLGEEYGKDDSPVSPVGVGILLTEVYLGNFEVVDKIL